MIGKKISAFWLSIGCVSTVLILSLFSQPYFRAKLSSLYSRVEIFSLSSWGKVFIPQGGDELALAKEILSLRDFLQKNNLERLSVSEGVISEITFYQRFAEGIYPIRITDGTSLLLICYWEENQYLGESNFDVLWKDSSYILISNKS